MYTVHSWFGALVLALQGIQVSDAKNKVGMGFMTGLCGCHG